LAGQVNRRRRLRRLRRLRSAPLSATPTPTALPGAPALLCDKVHASQHQHNSQENGHDADGADHRVPFVVFRLV
jgi:hypothetical protein